MFIGLLNVCIIRNFTGSLPSNSLETISKQSTCHGRPTL